MPVTWKSLAFAPVLLAAGIGLAVAEAGDRPDRDPASRMARHLSLNEAQRASVEAIFERNQPAREALGKRHRAHREALRALNPGSPDHATRAQALADEAGTLARDRVLQRAQLDAELAGVLTPEQMAKWVEHKARPHHGRWKHRGERPGPVPAS